MFLKCGYNEAEINDAKASVLELDRLHILGIATPGILPPPSLPPVPSEKGNPPTFVPFMFHLSQKNSSASLNKSHHAI